MRQTAASAVLVVLAKAREAMHTFAEKGDENKTSLMCLGAIEPLSRLISHEDKTAVVSLGVMASNNEVKKCLKTLNVIPFATLCLTSLSVDFSYKVQIFENKGLEPLIQLLSSPDPNVKKNSVECIFNLTQDFQNRAAVQRLNAPHPFIQQLALRTIENITTDSESRVGFRNVQGFDRILEILRPKEFSDLHEGALRVILNCLQMMGGLEQLLQFVGTSTHIQGIYLYLHVRIRTLKVHFSTLRQQITTLKGAYLYFKCL
uniref:Armadillo repeat containing 3 n=1 Tax=Cyprinus carpio carpio TaxID=630221 RepID=A0A9J8BBD3_CYPCA